MTISDKNKGAATTEFQEALLGFLKEISETIHDDQMALEQKIQKLISMNEKMMHSLSEAAMLDVTKLEKNMAEKLVNVLNIRLSNDYTENERLLKVLRGEIKDIKKELIQQLKPKI
jgi:predicted nucleotidyltransferase component of viral defense system